MVDYPLQKEHKLKRTENKMGAKCSRNPESSHPPLRIAGLLAREAKPNWPPLYRRSLPGDCIGPVSSSGPSHLLSEDRAWGVGLR